MDVSAGARAEAGCRGHHGGYRRCGRRASGHVLVRADGHSGGRRAGHPVQTLSEGTLSGYHH